MIAQLIVGLREAARILERYEAENVRLHKLVIVLSQMACLCPPCQDNGYREIAESCEIHKPGGMQRLSDEAEHLAVDPSEWARRRRELQAMGTAPKAGRTRRNCNCRWHGGDPVRRPWRGCPKHGS